MMAEDGKEVVGGENRKKLFESATKANTQAAGRGEGVDLHLLRECE
jgi:hypothetical protein